VAADGSTAAITVTLYVSSGSANGVTVSPGVVYNFPAVAQGSSTSQSQTFTVTGGTGIVLGTPTQTTSSSIFSLNIQTSTTSSETFYVTANPTGLSAGVYSTVIAITSTGTSSGVTNILVTLTVGSTGCVTNCTTTGTVTSIVVPTSLTFADTVGDTYYQEGGAAQSITVTGASGTQYSSVINYGSGQPTGWLSFGLGGGSGTFGTTPAFVQVNIAPDNITTPGTYTATVVVTTPSGPTNVAVTLLMTARTSYVILGSPASTTFYYSTGANPPAQSFRVGDTNEGFPPLAGYNPQSVTVTVPASASWLTATTSGNLVTLNVNPTGIATGAYWTDISVAASGYANTPLQYPVVLVIGNGIGQTNGPLTLNPGSLTFAATANGTAPGSQTLAVTAASSTSVTLSVSQGSCSPGTTPSWLSVSPASNFTAGSTATNLTVSVNQTGLASGTTCTGSVVLNTSGGTQMVGVTLTVGASGTSGNVTVTPATLQPFTFTVGGTTPAAQVVNIVNATTGTGVTPFTVAASYTTGTNWITLTNDQGASVTGGSTPFNLHIGVNPSGLTASPTAYTGTVTITPTGGTTVQITVSLTVSSTPTVTATPTSLTFTYTAGGNTPSAQTVNVSAGGSSAAFTVALSSSGWLHVTPTSGTTPNSGSFPLSVTVDPTGLNAGPYNGTITVAGTSPATGTTIIAVSFTVSAPLPTITGVTNAASGATGGVSPGEIITLYANLSNPIGPATLVSLNSTTCPSPCTQLPTTMGGVQVVFLPSGVSAPLIYVSATQVSAIVPYEVAGVANLQVEVKFLGQSSNAFVLQTASAAPGIFTQNQQGSGLGAVLVTDPSGTLLGPNSSSIQAGAGYYLSIYATGEGATSPPGVTGKITPVTAPYPVPLLTPTTCLVGTQPANVGYSGEAPGLVAGVWQINIQVPAGAGTGQMSLSCSIGGSSHTTQTGVTVFLK